MTKLDLYHHAGRRIARAQPRAPRRRRTDRRRRSWPCRPCCTSWRSSRVTSSSRRSRASRSCSRCCTSRSGTRRAAAAWPTPDSSWPSVAAHLTLPIEAEHEAASSPAGAERMIAATGRAGRSPAPVPRRPPGAGSSAWPRASRTSSVTSTTTCATGRASSARRPTAWPRATTRRRPRVRVVAAQGGDRRRDRSLRIDHRSHVGAGRRDRRGVRGVRSRRRACRCRRWRRRA